MSNFAQSLVQLRLKLHVVAPFWNPHAGVTSPVERIPELLLAFEIAVNEEESLESGLVLAFQKVKEFGLIGMSRVRVHDHNLGAQAMLFSEGELEDVGGGGPARPGDKKPATAERIAAARLSLSSFAPTRNSSIRNLLYVLKSHPPGRKRHTVRVPP